MLVKDALPVNYVLGRIGYCWVDAVDAAAGVHFFFVVAAFVFVLYHLVGFDFVPLPCARFPSS